ncbi:hypothetical protein JCM16814_30600 [Desulfobaculum senezii]
MRQLALIREGKTPQMKKFVFVLLAVLLTSCTAHRQGGGVVQGPDTGAIKALDVDFDKALEIAWDIAEDRFLDVESWGRGDGIKTKHRDMLMGGAVSIIKPVLVQSKDDPSNYGIIFDITSRPYGPDFSMAPGYMGTEFLEALEEYVAFNNIPQKTFSAYRRMPNKGMVATMPPSYPRTIEGFKEFLDGRPANRFEGIWTDDQSRYVMGLVHDKEDIRYPYKAYVLTSEEVEWRPGDVKIQFNKLKKDEACTSTYSRRKKDSQGVLWRVGKSEMLALNLGRRNRLALMKMYPDKDAGEVTVYTGTCWLLDDKGHAMTCAHVVDGAKQIQVYTSPTTFTSARVLLVDEGLDLAVLKIDAVPSHLKPLPVKLTGMTPQGEDVFVVGYPIASIIGTQLKMTEGIISSTRGYEETASQYQVSAMVNGGNSGGPLFDSCGRVIGVVSAKITLQNVEGIAYSVKSNYIGLMLDQLGIPRPAPAPAHPMTGKELFKKYSSSIFYVEVETR